MWSGGVSCRPRSELFSHRCRSSPSLMSAPLLVHPPTHHRPTHHRTSVCGRVVRWDHGHGEWTTDHARVQLSFGGSGDAGVATAAGRRRGRGRGDVGLRGRSTRLRAHPLQGRVRRDRRRCLPRLPRLIPKGKGNPVAAVHQRYDRANRKSGQGGSSHACVERVDQVLIPLHSIR